MTEQIEKLNLITYKFEPANPFSMPVDHVLLDEARRRGFAHGATPYNRLFSGLFFEGGRLNFKQNIDPDFKSKATQYLKCFMGSYEPQHEQKEAICALILSELVEITETNQ